MLNTTFVKAAPTIAKRPIFGKNVKPPLLDVKVKRFVPVCHYCNKPGHIRPKCYKYKKMLRMNKIEQPCCYKPRIVPIQKIDLKNKSVKKIWVKNHI